MSGYYREGQYLSTMCCINKLIDEAKCYDEIRESTPAMKTVTVSTKSISTRWKVSGRCCALGCAHIAAFLRKSCRLTWDSLNSYTMLDGVAEPCWGHFWTHYCNR